MRKSASPRKTRQRPIEAGSKSRTDPLVSISPAELVRSASFQKATAKAKWYARNPERLGKLFQSASKKARESSTASFADSWAYLLTMIRLLRAYSCSEYREIPLEHFLVVLAAVIYFVTPEDFIPDWVPFVGMIDDAFVIGLALRAVRADLDAFMNWETSNV